MADTNSSSTGRASPRQYPPELKRRAIRLVRESLDRRGPLPDTSRGPSLRGCSAPAVVAEEVEAELCKRISRAVLPADIIELAREELRKRLALPRDDGKLRRRLEQRRERLSQLFAWGDLTEAEYRRQKTEVERDLTMLPDDDKLVLFDRHRRLMVSMAENVAAATPEQLRELILMLVERAETRDRGLGPVRWTGPARPFFSVVGVAPPDGLEHPIPTQRAGLVSRGRVSGIPSPTNIPSDRPRRPRSRRPAALSGMGAGVVHVVQGVVHVQLVVPDHPA